MCFRQHFTDFRDDFHRALGLELPLARERLGERRALDVLHDDEGAAVGEVPGVEDNLGGVHLLTLSFGKAGSLRTARTFSLLDAGLAERRRGRGRAPRVKPNWD